jgi:ATP-dependent Lon protease
MMCTMSNENSEYHKIQEWLHGFLRIPFGIYRNLPVAKTDGRTACSRFMHESARILDESIYGHTVAKMQLIQYIGQLIANPDTAGNAIAIYGPPGTGKTSLIQNGVSKILHRPFHFISLGGSTDSSLLIGHGYTYEGSVWGRIVDILMQSQCMNPIIYFDELDKVSETEKGEEIIGILTHLTDITQNHHFHDRYFSGIDFDLSRVLFIFSYNDQTKINRILRDRMHNIEVKGFTVKDKIQIARKFLIPKIEEQLLLAAADFNIEIDNVVLTHIIEKYTENEKGVRNLKRAIETIWTKINLIQFIDQDDENIKNNREYFGFISKLRFNSGEKNSVSITTDVADLLMADRSTLNDNVSHSHMYA